MGVGLPAGFAGGYMQDRWDAPPPELGEVERKGFHDGIEGAHKDAGNHRAFNVNNRDEFRHPHVPDRDKEAYRHGFERGYQAGVAHWEREHRW
jgi:ribosome modulation factor